MNHLAWIYTGAGILVFCLGLRVGWVCRSRAVTRLVTEVIDANARGADLRHQRDEATDIGLEWKAVADQLHADVLHAQSDAAAWQRRHDALILDPTINPLLVDLLADQRYQVPALDPDTAAALAALNGDTGQWVSYMRLHAADPPPVRRETDRQRGRRIKNEHKALGPVSVA